MKTTNMILLGILVIYFASFGANALLEFLSLENYVEANVLKVIGTTIIIGNNCTAIKADTSPERAQSIQLGLEKKISDRPNTHDSFAAVLKSFNITLEAVKLERYDGKYYYSDMILKAGDKILKLDVMPSDGIAVALRTGSKIYLNKTMLFEVGKNIC